MCRRVNVAAAEVAEQTHGAAGASQWSAYADGAPAAALGGRGVSTPPNQVLSRARETADLAATALQGARAVEVVPTTESSKDELPEFVYSFVEDWFINLFAPTIERPLDASGAGTPTWCPEWWQHLESIAPLEAL